MGTSSAGAASSDHAGIYARALLYAIARDEAAGRRSARLTETDLATWQRFRGRLGSGDLLRLLAEDAAVGFPVPFDLRTWAPKLDLGTVADDLVDGWLASRPKLDLPSAAYIEAQAKALGIGTRLARSELHQVQGHQKVLELPGTGGQLAHHLVTTQPALTLQGNVVIACAGWQELALAGIVALDVGAPPGHTAIVSVGADDLLDDQHPLRQQRFDFVVGLHPDKGGRFQIADQLALWYHGAKLVLV